MKKGTKRTVIFLVILLIIAGGGIFFLYPRYGSKLPSFHKQQMPIHDSVQRTPIPDTTITKITDTVNKHRDGKKAGVNSKKISPKKDSVVIIVKKIIEPEINHDSARRAMLENDFSYQKFLSAVKKERAESPIHRTTVKELLTPLFFTTTSPNISNSNEKTEKEDRPRNKKEKKHRHKKNQKAELIDSTNITSLDTAIYVDTLCNDDRQLGSNISKKLNKTTDTSQEIIQYNIEKGVSWQVVPVDTNWSQPIIVTKDFVNSFLTNDTIKVELQYTFPNGKLKEKKHLGRKKHLHRTFPFKTELRWRAPMRTYIIVKQESFEHRKRLRD